MGIYSQSAKEIVKYLKELRHPLFGLKPLMVEQNESFLEYPVVVDATTSLSGRELAYALNFPKKPIPGLPVIECTEFGRNVVTYELENLNIQYYLGNIFHMLQEEQVLVSLSKESLSSHIFITGSTGSGKSNTIYHLLNEAREDGVKFLIIEPAKGEYKHIFGNDENVQVYGTNPGLTDLLQINPFSFPEEIHILEHLDRLVEIFNVCWPMYAAMPAVLKNAIEKSYEDCGWNLINSTNKYSKKIYPDFKDVSENVRSIIDKSDYDTDNQGAYKGSLITRLESLQNGLNGRIFSSHEIALHKLFDENTIIDLSRVGSSETKSLIMGMLIIKLQEFRMSQQTGMNIPLKHLTVLEEAHNLLKNSISNPNSESSNLAGKSVEMLANAIAEMRTYGEGFIIADQAPGLLDKSVIRNTNTKIVMRLPDQEDRELVGKASNLNEDQIKELAKLPKGVAAVYQNDWIQPVLCKVPKFENSSGRYQFDNPLSEKLETLKRKLLDILIEENLYETKDKDRLKNLFTETINSSLPSSFKRNLAEFLNTDQRETEKITYRKMLFELLGAEKAFKKTETVADIQKRVDILHNFLNPSIIEYYDENKISLVLALLFQEAASRSDKEIEQYIRLVNQIDKFGGILK